MVCATCGHRNEPPAAVCDNCGEPLRPRSTIHLDDHARIARGIGFALLATALGAGVLFAVSALRGDDDNRARVTATPTTATSTQAGATMPNVVGMHVDKARAALAALRITVKQTPRESIQPPGTVMEQTPPAGTATSEANLVVAAKADRLSGDSKLRLNGFGGIAVGMTIAEAEAAGGRRLVANGPTAFCTEWDVAGLKGVSVMTWEGRVVRIAIHAGRFTTQSGVGIGATERDVLAKYPNRIQTRPHPTDNEGHYLEYVAQDAGQRRFSLIFETDGTRVTQFRAGTRDAVALVEGCA